MTAQDRDQNQRSHPDADEDVEKVEAEIVDDEPQADDGECGSTSSEAEQARQELEEQFDILKKRYIMLKADFENYKRRTQAQMEEIRKNANEELVQELLPILDNFERALNSTDEGSGFRQGVEMIFQQLHNCLAKQGLKPIASEGQPFDPRYHEAVSMEGSPEGELVVKEELQKGYVFQDKVLRASMVHVTQEDLTEEDEGNGQSDRN